MRSHCILLFVALFSLVHAPLPLSAASVLVEAPPFAVCSTSSQGAFTLRVPGYVHRADGRTEVVLELGAEGQAPVALTVVAAGWRGVEPAAGSIFTGLIGQYEVSVLHPSPEADTGFIRFVRREFWGGHNESFVLSVAEFDPFLPVTVQVESADHQESFLVNLGHPACNRTPTAPLPSAALLPSSPASTPNWLPTYQSHVVMDNDFGRVWTDAEKQALWDVGLPVPDVATSLVNVFQTVAPLGQGQSGLVGVEDLRDADESGWSTLWRDNFDREGLDPALGGSCRFVLASTGRKYQWGDDRARTFGGSAGAASPVRGGSEGRTHQPTNAAGDLVSQMACVFDDMTAARNLMVQFALWMDQGSDGGSFFVGYSVDGRNFQGRRWRNSFQQEDGSSTWAEQRLFVPFVGEAAATNGGRVAILWEYRSENPVSIGQGTWVDEVLVQRYDPPPLNCRENDPHIFVPGTPGNALVSKGINLPPYPMETPSGLSGHVERLKQSGVGWARLEFQGPLHPSVPLLLLDGPGSLLNYVDLKHYDTLIHLLCAGGQPIAVLGLLDYKLLPDDAWRSSGHLGQAYVDSFLATTRLLVRYYRDRLRAWEVWNEPDFDDTYVQARDYASLLDTAYDEIKAEDASASVLFGGLGGVDWVAASYFRQVISWWPQGRVPYDVLSIHPYPSKEFRRSGQIIRDPSYLRAQQPTVLTRFMDIMGTAGHGERPIWVTELGWNRAADSQNPATLTCQRVYETMVTGAEQALYLPVQFDILFRETAWASGRPSVAKIFWYQYADVGVGISEAECRGDRQEAGSDAVRIVDWWYGLYSGTDPASGVDEPAPNQSECTFRVYPDPTAVSRCLQDLQLTGSP